MPTDDNRYSIDQLIRRTVDAHIAETQYRDQVERTLDRWLDAEAAASSIGRLPALTCAAAGGDSRRATPVVGAWHLVRLALKLFDDVEDGDVDRHAGEHTNVATGVLMLTQAVLEPASDGDVLPVDAPARRIRRSLQRAVLTACAGQHDDLIANRSPVSYVDPETWLQIAGAKSGGLCGWAAWAGALAAGADEPGLSAYRTYGYHLGVILQLVDDFNDVWQPTGVSDLASGTLTLPVCYALFVTDGEQRAELLRLLKRARTGDAAAVAGALDALTDVGAHAYLLTVARMHQRAALAALDRTRTHAGDPAHEALVGLPSQLFPALTMVGEE